MSDQHKASPEELTRDFETLADDALPPRVFRASERIRLAMAAQAEEIQRLHAESLGAFAILVQVGKALSANPREDLIAVALRVVAERDALKAELANLKPSGQVAEDEEQIDASWATLPKPCSR